MQEEKSRRFVNYPKREVLTETHFHCQITRHRHKSSALGSKEIGRAIQHPTSGQKRDKVRTVVQTRTGYLELSIEPKWREDMFWSQDQKGNKKGDLILTWE